MNWDINIPDNLAFAMNSTLGSMLIIVLILVNYITKYDPDHFQRSIFCSLLIFYFVSILSDFLFLFFQGKSGRIVYSFLYVFVVWHYLTQMLCYCYMAVFIDYMAFRKKSRSDKIILFSYLAFAVYSFFLLFGCRDGFFISIDSGNILHRGSHFFIRYIMVGCPMLFALGELILYRSLLKSSNFTVFIRLLAFFLIGSTLDFLFVTTSLAWPWETAALLYSYFFIVQSYVRIDPLTDIGNRLSFNEFTNQLSRHNSGESWAIVMLDMDHFKKINDTLGHQEGDRALGGMAVVLKGCITKNGFVARYGGDEFVLTTRVDKGGKEDGRNKISILMAEIQSVIDQFNVKKIRPYKLEISYGYDIYTADGKQSMEEFLNHIDSLMYTHKQERRRASDKREGAAG
jgi:diguanylate cyclase (GGDEF)-like protein